uniref:Uncharacterized protein n=1 Tax=Cacopsylla melanoneura TaxID=428564 RepID=A0A8D8RF34_9HEMI
MLSFRVERRGDRTGSVETRGIQVLGISVVGVEARLDLEGTVSSVNVLGVSIVFKVLGPSVDGVEGTLTLDELGVSVAEWSVSFEALPASLERSLSTPDVDFESSGTSFSINDFTVVSDSLERFISIFVADFDSETIADFTLSGTTIDLDSAFTVFSSLSDLVPLSISFASVFTSGLAASVSDSFFLALVSASFASGLSSAVDRFSDNFFNISFLTAALSE